MTFSLRAYRADKEVGEPGSPIRFIASTSGKKRDGLDLNQDNWSLENYRKNPIVLWAHDYMGRNLPIGKAVVEVVDGKLMADIVFDPNDVFAQQVEGKYRTGFLNAISTAWEIIQVDGKKKNDLLDLSSVPVPGDPTALMERQRVAIRSLGRELLEEIGDDSPAPKPDKSNTPEPNPASERAEHDEDGDEMPEITPEILDTILAKLDYNLIAELVADLLKEDEPEPEGAEGEGENEMDTDGDQAGQEDADGGQRAGAVLSKRNTSDLNQAIELILTVMKRAAPPEKEERNLTSEEIQVRAWIEDLNLDPISEGEN